MGASNFSGPIKAGTVKEGANKNVGFVAMSQSAPWLQSTTAVASGIIIPAGSQITEIQFTIDVAPDAGNISVGTSITSTELLTALVAGTAPNVFLFGTAATITDIAVWADVGAVDVSIFVDCSAGTSGVGFITVHYLQAIDLA